MTKQIFGQSTFPLSPAIRAGDFVFVSGQVPVDADGKVADGGIAAETAQVIHNIAEKLKLAGCDLSDVVKTTVFLRDRADFDAFTEVYRKHFLADPPTQTAVEARMIRDIAVEVEAIAYKPL